MKIEIYEKALCCDTGVCGDEVDTELLRITSLVSQLKTTGKDIERYNLSSRPDKFMTNPLVIQQIQTRGIEILPLTLVDGKIFKEKVYPTNAEIENLFNVKVEEKIANSECKCKSNKKGCC